MRLAAIFASSILLENYRQDISINNVKQDINVCKFILNQYKHLLFYVTPIY